MNGEKKVSIVSMYRSIRGGGILVPGGSWEKMNELLVFFVHYHEQGTE